MPVIPPSRKASVTLPPSIQPYLASRASEPPPSPTRPLYSTISPTGPLFLRVTKTSTFSTIPLDPATGSSKLGSTQRSRIQALIANQANANSQRPTAAAATRTPLSRLDAALERALPNTAVPNPPTPRRQSIPKTPTPTPPSPKSKPAVELNRAGFAANSLLRNGNLGDRDDDDEEEEDMPPALTSAIASLRRMNSGISRSSSLRSITDRAAFSASSVFMSAAEIAAAGEEGKEKQGGRWQVSGLAVDEFTFEVSNPNVSGKGALGLREGSSGTVNALVMPQNLQRLSLAWKPGEGAVSKIGSPARFNGTSARESMRSLENLRLYDPQGFLIPSPVRGVNPSGLRV
ncbi:hypothetical protein N657DRAFT_678325 [Parathielavia appendiculata]|uniref:Uncharacterized protein n=1 Tax=Parathielavia appendiculata TaxID=2587402 RepID=A0AAN6U8E7_9PEZI|nr:hypothetical protein N657DRAFT_678325 [Parathielavia appendiculata]